MQFKQRLSDLAIFGGRPAFDEKLHIGRPNIGDRSRLLARFNDMLDRRWLTNDGPYAQEFEKKIVELVGVKHCLVTCNATVALEMTIRAVGLSGEVIVPSFTFVATAHALQWQEITPVFCDIDPDTCNLDPDAVEEMITPRTTGILGVHVWGRPCPVEALTQIAERHHLKLLFDAAHAFGCSHKGRMIGNFGSAEIFSFHATKVLNSFEGGAVVTNDDELADRIKMMRNFGFADYDDVVYLGINGKMSEASAVMGLTSLESLQEFIDVNHRNYLQYQQELADIPHLKFVSYDPLERSNYQYVVAEIDRALTPLTRDQLQKILWAENVLARRYFYPGCHRMEPYRTTFPRAGEHLPATECLSARVLTLPTGTAVQPDDISKVCQIIRFVIEHRDEVGQKLGERELVGTHSENV